MSKSSCNKVEDPEEGTVVLLSNLHYNDPNNSNVSADYSIDPNKSRLSRDITVSCWKLKNMLEQEWRRIKEGEGLKQVFVFHICSDAVGERSWISIRSRSSRMRSNANPVEGGWIDALVSGEATDDDLLHHNVPCHIRVYNITIWENEIQFLGKTESDCGDWERIQLPAKIG